MYKMHKQWLEDLSNLLTKSPIANRLCLQFLLHSERRGGVFQRQEEPPKAEAQQQSWLAFHVNRP